MMESLNFTPLLFSNFPFSIFHFPFSIFSFSFPFPPHFPLTYPSPTYLPPPPPSMQVYAEASVTVHDYDIILEMTIINRTPNTLTNLTVELATMGDLKIVERPQSYTIGPLDERKLRTNIKVSSTETGHIFGTIVFDQSSSAQKTFVSLNDIQLDIMDYIRPAECKSEDFRSMWAEFEWENKVRTHPSIDV